MKILIACEESQTICKEFRRLWHEAYSCDIQECSWWHPEWHIQGDAIEEAYSGKYDMMIAHPPCTYLTSTWERWFYHNDDKHLPTKDRRPHPLFPNRRKDREESIEFFIKLWNAPIKYIAIENPVGYMNTHFMKPTQIIQPFNFWENASKKTCLWIKNLPLLKWTKTVECEYVSTSTWKRFDKWYWNTSKLKGTARQKERSKTFPGIAKAIAEQWSNL